MTPPRLADPDDQGAGPGGVPFFQGEILQAEVGAAAFEPQLADAPAGPPAGYAVGGLGRQLVGGVSEKQQVRFFEGLHWL